MNDAYLAAVFHGPRSEEGWPVSFAVVTACNPDGIETDEETNRKATRELEATIDQMGFRFGPMTGGSADGTHREFGYLVECDLSSALKLGKIFRQEAVFWIEDGNLCVVNCSDGSDKRFVDVWENRYMGEEF